MLAKLTEQAAQTLDPAYTVNATSNWYFMIASTFLTTVLGTLVTARIVEPMLGPWHAAPGSGLDSDHDATEQERRAFSKASAVGALVALGLVLLAALCR